MKPTILRRHLFSLLAILAAIVCLAIPANAQTHYTSDEINNAILLPGSIVPEWNQPQDYPWQIDGNKIYSFKSNTHLRFYYKSDKETILTIYTSTGDFKIYDYATNTDLTGWVTYNRMIKLDAGEHELSLYSDQDNSPAKYLTNFGIFEISDSIDSKLITTAKSLPIEIKNDETNPWFISNNEIWSSRTTTGEASSAVTLKFTIDKISKLSWKSCRIQYNNGSNSTYLGTQLNLYNDNILYNQYAENYEYTVHTEVFQPGSYEIKLEENQYRTSTSSPKGCLQSRVCDIELRDEWFTVDVVPGDLGSSVIDEISKVNYSYLTDVELLKVKGKLNASDWATITQMTNLKGLDLEETDVTEIPTGHFKDNLMMSYIKLPAHLKTINNEAFSKSNLKYITLPSELESIGASAFYGNKIVDLTVPASTQRIGERAFAVTWIKNLSFEENSRLNTLGYLAFADSNVKGVALPDSLTTFITQRGSLNDAGTSYSTGTSSSYTWYANLAFAWCDQLESIKFPSSLKTIPQAICVGTTSLKSVVFPEDVEIIDRGAFQNSGIKSLNFPNTLQRIEYRAFRQSALSDSTYTVVMPKSLDFIGEEAFYGNCLSKVELPSHLSTIGLRAFYWTNLTEVQIPLYLKNIYAGAFNSNYKLKTITLHSGARNLPNFLTDCPALETIVLPCATPPTRSADILGTQDKKRINLIVPDFALSSYRLDEYWYTFGSITAGPEATDQAYWNVTGDLKLREGRRMTGFPEVEISNGASVMVIGSTPASFGDLTFNFSETAPASFVNYCDQATAGSINVRFAVAANRWYMFTPMFDVNISDITVTGTENFVFRYYDADSRAANGGVTDVSKSSANWKNVTDGVLKAGQGYIFQCDAAGEIIFPENSVADSPVLATTQTDVPLIEHSCENTANKDWNLIGNPYPAYFDAWYLDVEAPITVYSINSSNRVTYSALSLTDDEYVLRPMEAFFIQKPADCDAAVFEIDGRQATKTIGMHQGQKAKRRAAAAEGRNLFNIEILDSEGMSLDRTRVVINENASLDYEIRWDASKFISEGEAQLYTLDHEGNRLAINERPLADAQVMLGIQTGNARNYTIQASRADGDLWLIDLKTGAETDLTAAPFHLSADANSTIEGRYALRFVPAASGVDTASMTSKVFAGKGYISVENPKAETVTIHALDGSEILRGAETSFQVETSSGIYLVRIAGKTQKVIVK